MARAHVLGATSIAVGATALAVLIGYLGGQLGTAPDQRITASEDAYAATADPHHASGDRPALMAGGMGGGAAITYLKFTVSGLRGGKPPARAEVRLSRREGVLPAHVELTRVPATGWRERSLNARSAPPLGSVVASVRPKEYDKTVVFDVSRVIRKAGTYSFAVTAPAGDGFATFFAKDGVLPGNGLVKPTLWLSWLGSVLGWESPSASSDPTATASPDPDPSLTAPVPATASPSPTPTPSPTTTPSPSATAEPDPTATAAPGQTPTPTVPPSPSPSAPDPDPECVTGDLLVPTCGVLWGVAPGAHTDIPRRLALDEFEAKTGRQQAVYHSYHRGTEIFPTEQEIAIAGQRILFINWKPQGATWAAIAEGDPATEAYFDRLAAHLKRTVTAPFFFAVHHEPEDNVDPREGSGYTAQDYAAMYRHTVTGLRARGVTTIVSTMVYMSYVPWNTQPWFEELYPGDDVVDWVGWDVYAYSEPGYGHGDFAEMMNRRSSSKPSWPGFYNWAAERHPDKPLMLGEWGVWHSPNNLGHRAYFYGSVARQMPLFPRVKALVYFDTPHDQRGYDSRVDRTPDGLVAYQALGRERMFQVRVTLAAGATPPTPSP